MTLNQQRDPYWKVLIAMLLLAALALFTKDMKSYGQTTVPKPGRTFTMCGTPAGAMAEFVNGKDIVWDSCANAYYMRKTNTAGFFKVDYAEGANGLPAIMEIGQVTTLPPGSQATAGVKFIGGNTYTLDLGLVTGNTGSGGGGAAIFPGLLSPDAAGAKHTAQFVSSADLSKFPGTGVTTSDTYDWAAWQLCINQGDMKCIVAAGVYYWNRPLIKPDLYRCKIMGNNGKAITSNGNPFIMLTTNMPADFSAAEARCGAGANFVIEDFRFEGVLGQTAFQPYATSDNYLRNVTTAGFTTGLNLHFCLGGIYDNITCLNGTNGMLLNWGGYPNATPFPRFPTSNGSKVRNFHAVGITNIGIANYGAYDVEMDIKAIEGGTGTINRAIDIDDIGNTGCKNFFITSGDFEGITIAPGAGNAYLHLKTVVGGSKTSIRGTLMHTAGIFIWADGQNAPTIIVDRVNYILSGQNGGKSLVNFGYTWQFDYCDQYPFPSVITSQFSSEGQLVTPCNPVNGQPTYNAQGCGSNHYNYTTQGK